MFDKQAGCLYDEEFRRMYTTGEFTSAQQEHLRRCSSCNARVYGALHQYIAHIRRAMAFLDPRELCKHITEEDLARAQAGKPLTCGGASHVVHCIDCKGALKNVLVCDEPIIV